MEKCLKIVVFTQTATFKGGGHFLKYLNLNILSFQKTIFRLKTIQKEKTRRKTHEKSNFDLKQGEQHPCAGQNIQQWFFTQINVQDADQDSQKKLMDLLHFTRKVPILFPHSIMEIFSGLL